MKEIVNLEYVDSRPRWGCVSLHDRTTGALVKQVEISVEEAESYHNHVGENPIPTGITKEEFNNYDISISNRALLEGQALESNGHLFAMAKKITIDGVVHAKLLKIPPSEWEKVGDVISVEPAVKAEIEKIWP